MGSLSPKQLSTLEVTYPEAVARVSVSCNTSQCSCTLTVYTERAEKDHTHQLHAAKLRVQKERSKNRLRDGVYLRSAPGLPVTSGMSANGRD